MIRHWVALYALGALTLGAGGFLAQGVLPSGITLDHCGKALNASALNPNRGRALALPSVSLRTHLGEASLARSLGGDFIPAGVSGSLLPPMVYRGELDGGVMMTAGAGVAWTAGTEARAWLSTEEGAYELRLEMPQAPVKRRHCPMAGRSRALPTPTPSKVIPQGLG